MVLNTSAEKGAPAVPGRSTRSPVLGWVPTRAGRWSGEGSRPTMASRITAEPRLVREAQAHTGAIWPLRTAAARPVVSSSSVSSPSSRNFSSISSSVSATYSITLSRRVLASSARSAGISATLTLPPSANSRALPATMSTTPRKASSAPMGR